MRPPDQAMTCTIAANQITISPPLLNATGTFTSQITVKAGTVSSCAAQFLAAPS